MNLNNLFLILKSQKNGINFNYKACTLKKLFRLIFILIFVDIFFIWFYILYPNYLDKPARIKIVDNYPAFDFATKLGNKSKVFSILKNKKNLYGRFYAESRSNRINRFLQGYGNCANQASGLGILLNHSGANYAIIHMLNVDDYLVGKGHSIVYTSLDGKFILFDPYGGSIILNRGQFANFHDLMSAVTTSKIELEDIVININNPAASNKLFQKPNLESMFIGVTIEKEINNYYSFVNLIGVEHNLESKLNQTIIRGSALMINLLPSTFMFQKTF